MKNDHQNIFIGDVLRARPISKCRMPIRERMEYAFETGAAFAEQAVHVSGTRAVDEALWKMRPPSTNSFLPHKEPTIWDQIYLAIYWFAASYESERAGRKKDAERTHAGIFGVHAQRELTEALMSLDADDRKELYELFDDRDTHLIRHWKNNYSGSISVIRVAICLDALGVQPIIPPPVMDRRYKIDLLGKLADRERKVLGVQVKGVQSTESSFRLLTRDNTNGIEDWLLRHMLERLPEMETRFHVTCFPVLANVGNVSMKPWRTEPPASLTSSFRELLEDLQY